MKIKIADSQLAMKNMEIDLSELNDSLMPKLSDSAEMLISTLPTKDKVY